VLQSMANQPAGAPENQRQVGDAGLVRGLASRPPGVCCAAPDGRPGGHPPHHCPGATHDRAHAKTSSSAIIGDKSHPRPSFSIQRR